MLQHLPLGTMNATLNTALVALATTGSVWFGTDGDRRLIITLFAITALIIYRLLREVKEIDGFWSFLNQNVVELALMGTIAPGAFESLMEIVKSVAKAIPETVGYLF